jgi:hypothetical protein
MSICTFCSKNHLEQKRKSLFLVAYVGVERLFLPKKYDRVVLSEVHG